MFKDYTRSRTGGCCHHRRTGICWKLLWAVQPQLGLLTLSWGEHVLERFHAAEHAGGYERSGPQQYYGRGRDAIPDDRYDTLSAGRGLMVCQL